MNLDQLKEQLLDHEGFEGQPYKCTANKTTIGIGRNLEANPLTLEESFYLLDNDIRRIIQALDKALPFWRMHSDARQHVIVDMAFNLGVSGLLTFRKMLTAYDQGDYKRAAEEMINSKWYGQVGRRAENLVQMMREG